DYYCYSADSTGIF
nr:immunoglobulin light chain junction region [Macaca mulatta]